MENLKNRIKSSKKNTQYLKSFNLSKKDKLFLIYPLEIPIFKLILEIEEIDLLNINNPLIFDQIRDKLQKETKECHYFLYDEITQNKLYLIKNSNKFNDCLSNGIFCLENYTITSFDKRQYLLIDYNKIPRKYLEKHIINTINECNTKNIKKIKDCLDNFSKSKDITSFKDINFDLQRELHYIKVKLSIALSLISKDLTHSDHGNLSHESYIEYISRIHYFASTMFKSELEIFNRKQYTYQISSFAELLSNLFKLNRSLDILTSTENNVEKIKLSFNEYKKILMIDKLLEEVKNIEIYTDSKKMEEYLNLFKKEEENA